MIRKRAIGQLKSLWQNIIGSVHGRMRRQGVQHVAPCKLFSQCFFLSSYEVSAGKDDEQADLPLARMIRVRDAQLLQNVDLTQNHLGVLSASLACEANF